MLPAINSISLQWGRTLKLLLVVVDRTPSSYFPLPLIRHPIFHLYSNIDITNPHGFPKRIFPS